MARNEHLRQLGWAGGERGLLGDRRGRVGAWLLAYPETKSLYPHGKVSIPALRERERERERETGSTNPGRGRGRESQAVSIAEGGAQGGPDSPTPEIMT